MRLLIKLLLFGAFAFFVYATFARLAYGTGAPIPWKMGEYRYPPAVQNSSVVLIYTQGKAYRNDRLFAGSFQ